MTTHRISATDVDRYKQQLLDQTVLVAPAEAARILAVSERTLHTLVREGELHGYARQKGSRGLRLLASELKSYVESIKISPDTWRE